MLVLHSGARPLPTPLARARHMQGTDWTKEAVHIGTLKAPGLQYLSSL